MDENDRRIRNITYQAFLSSGTAPRPAEVARRVAADTDEVEAAWRRLNEEHALVLYPKSTNLRMLNPFSLVPTAYRVEAGGRSWYANCAWDAFGIGSALGSDSEIHASCPDCGEAIHESVRNRMPSDETLLFHCLVPARQWWDDITFT